ncbi:MAG: hypothetical protein R3190_04675, partial [Thermoanaerobaculia bacterium]|nr:hypothetical protein [Thermoanaerobaculia bacterium]
MSRRPELARRRGLGWEVALGIGLLFVTARTVAAVAALAAGSPRLPLWDEAKYGRDGVLLAEAARGLDPLRWLALVYGLDDWPPVFPLYEMAVFLGFGYDYPVARLAVTAAFAGLVVATWWVGRQVAPATPAVGVLAALLVLVSPIIQVFGALAMLEVPAALLLLLSLGAWASHLRSGSRRSLIATCLCSLALFFCKYNYGLLWLGSLAGFEAYRAAGSWRAAMAALARRARSYRWRRPWPIFVATVLLALGLVVVTGGLRFELAGREISLTSPGNPLYLLCLLALARLALRPRTTWRRYRTWRLSLAPPHRRLLEWIGLPIAVWLLLPPHLKSFVDFVQNRSSGLGLLHPDGWLYYPRSFVADWHPVPALGWVAMALVVVAFVWACFQLYIAS